MDLDLYIDQLRSVIKSWSTNPIVIDSDGSVLHGLEVYNALWSLGTKYVPVAESSDETKYRISLDDLGFYNNVTVRNPRVYMDLMDFLENDNPTPLVKLKYMSKRDLTKRLG
jgi:cysteine synthase/O-phosphoserine sulfhydrylase/cystathionine beta-synthase